MLPVTFKVKLLFQLAIVFIIFNTATSNLNKMMIYNKKKKKHLVATTLKKKACLMEQFYRHCSGTAIFFEEVNFILSVSYNNEIKLKVTLPFS